MHRPGLVRASLLTLLVAVFLWLSWTGKLDYLSENQLQPAFKTTLLTFAAARGLNSVISVAQGTELALQPAGIGVSLSVGEILDPLNDLVERFSWLVLMAAASLGIQITLMEIFSNPVVSVAFAIIPTFCLFIVWLDWSRFLVFSHHIRISPHAIRIASAVMLIRFTLVVVTLLAGLFSQLFLADKQADALQVLQQTSSVAEKQVLQQTAPSESNSLADIFTSFIDKQKESMNMESHITELKERVESAIGHIINLIVIFLLQTLFIPLAILYLFLNIIRATWKALTPESLTLGKT